MNRADLQALTDLRVQEAIVLRTAGFQEGAYYLLGYAVECALKACVAKQIREHDFPDKELVQGAYTHDLAKLLILSGLKPQFDLEVNTNPLLGVNWSLVKAWKETARYSLPATAKVVDAFFSAILDPKDGCFHG